MQVLFWSRFQKVEMFVIPTLAGMGQIAVPKFGSIKMGGRGRGRQGVVTTYLGEDKLCQ